MKKMEAKLDIARSLSNLFGRILRQTGRKRAVERRLALIERISLTQHQTLALVEADGRRLLVATSPDGAPAFFSLEQPQIGNGSIARLKSMGTGRRVSW